MNYFKCSQIFIIFLIIIFTFSFGVAGEFTVDTGRGEIKGYEKSTVIKPAPTYRETILELKVYDSEVVESYYYFRGCEITVYTSEGVKKLFFPDPSPTWVKSPYDLTVHSLEGSRIHYNPDSTEVVESSYYNRGPEITVYASEGVKKLVLPGLSPTWVKSPSDLTAHSVEGSRTHYNPDSRPQKAAYKDNWRFVGEQCISGCSEESKASKVSSNSPQENSAEGEGITITITQRKAGVESRSQWLIPTSRGVKPPRGDL